MPPAILRPPGHARADVFVFVFVFNFNRTTEQPLLWPCWGPAGTTTPLCSFDAFKAQGDFSELPSRPDTQDCWDAQGTGALR